MIINQLFEAVYYGTDLEFKYNNFFYYINSGKSHNENGAKHLITVFKSKGSIYEGENAAECVEIYSSVDEKANVNTDSLFKSKIFDGKSLYEIVDSITDINY